MATSPTRRPFFHMVPANTPASESLQHTKNAEFVSPSALDGVLDLEVGFYVPKIPGDHVITRLGRNADLILREVPAAQRAAPMLQVHVAFEFNPVTKAIILDVRAKKSGCVSVCPISPTNDKYEGRDQTEPVPEKCVIMYGQNYRLNIASYVFNLTWPVGADTMPFKNFVHGQYLVSMRQANLLPSNLRPDPYQSSELQSWHRTAALSTEPCTVEEVDNCRDFIGEGGFGRVSKTLEKRGEAIAVKVIDLSNRENKEYDRLSIYKEIQALEKVEHPNIIEYYGKRDFDTDEPKIYMPLRDGNAMRLVENVVKVNPSEVPGICDAVMEQMLRALDYLASESMCHRDVKPENILYYHAKEPGGYVFQLADFGLATDDHDAKTCCGTKPYMAPEVALDYEVRQSPKMDVWSLFATYLAILPNIEFPPRRGLHYQAAYRAVRAAAGKMPDFAAMAVRDPRQRASAAQILKTRFNGRGMTTPESAVGQVTEVREEEVQTTSEPSTQTQLPLIQLPRRLKPKPRDRREPQEPREQTVTGFMGPYAVARAPGPASAPVQPHARATVQQPQAWATVQPQARATVQPQARGRSQGRGRRRTRSESPDRDLDRVYRSRSPTRRRAEQL